MILDIAHIGNPILRETARPVSDTELSSRKIQQFIDDLIETMRAANGAGLAATQVSVPLRIFAVEVADNPRYPYKPNVPLTVVVNPEMSFLSNERFENYEGCLSIPDLRGKVERCPIVRIMAKDRNGETFERIVKGITAGTFQHEYDHLNGVLFPDRVTDSRTFATWAEFRERYEEETKRNVEQIVARYGS